MIKKHFAILILLIFSIHLEGQEFIVKLGTNKIGINQSFRVSFEVNSNGSSFKPPALEFFQILSGPNQSSSMSMVNGQVTQSVSYSYTLRPRKLGNLEIGPASIHCNGKKLTTKPLTIEVVKDNVKQVQSNNNRSRNPFGQKQNLQKNNVNLDNDIHLTLSVNRSNLYQGEQLLATYKIYFSHNIQIQDYSELPKFKGFWSQNIDVPENNVKRENYKGKAYNAAVLKKVLLTPQRSGKLFIDPMGADLIAQIPTRGGWGFFQNYRKVEHKAQSNSITINVKPLPANGKPAGFNGAVGQFTLSSKLSSDSTKTNESVSLDVYLKGTGNISLFGLPELNIPTDIETYDPKKKENIKIKGSRNTGSKHFEYLLIPRFAGTYKIAPVEVSYFDPSQKKYITLKTSGYKLKVDGEQKGAQSSNTYASVSKDEVSLLGVDILFIKQNTSFKDTSSCFFGSVLFHFLWILPILVLILVVLMVRRVRQLFGNVTLLKRRRAGRLALKHLKRADEHRSKSESQAFYDSLSLGISGYIRDKFSISQAEISQEHIKKVLIKNNIDQITISSVVSLMNDCEMARYSPIMDEARIDEYYQKGVVLINEIEKQ